jgi:hypothetical protein
MTDYHLKRIITRRAYIGFEDESGVGISARSGQTSGAVGEPPEVEPTVQHARYDVPSIVTAEGELKYSFA